jgi:hypothetical protein
MLNKYVYPLLFPVLLFSLNWLFQKIMDCSKMFVKEETGEELRDPSAFPAFSGNEGYPLAR